MRSVPNPAVKEKRRELSRVKAELAQAEQAYGQHALENPEHGAHEDKQRHRGKYIVAGDVVDLADELENRNVTKAKEAEDEGHRHQ